MLTFALALCRVAPSRERGSKQVVTLENGLLRRRSLTGAWIETQASRAGSLTAPVAPSRERGSKPGRQRGTGRAGRRSLTGAWIETTFRCWDANSIRGRSLTGAWIETMSTR